MPPNYGGKNPLGAGNNPYGFPQYGPRTPMPGAPMPGGGSFGSNQPVIPPVKLPEGSEDFLPGGKWGNVAGWGKTAWDIYNAWNSRNQGGGGGGGGNSGGMSDFEKWMLILQTIQGVGGGVAGFLEGEQHNAREKEKLAENRRQFDLSQGLQEKQFGEGQRQFNIPTATELSRSQDVAPLRDRAVYMLAGRLGQVPGAFQGGGLSGPGAPSGVDFQQMQQRAAGYQPGAGGTEPGQAIRKRILGSLGYGGY